MSAEPSVDLGALSRRWQSFGCSVCGQTAPINAESGWRVELHHTVNRSQGGHDSPLLGLCGELCLNKCHWRVTTHRLYITLQEAAGGYVWTDTRSGESGLCRVLPPEELSLVPQGPVFDETRFDGRVIQLEALPPGVDTTHGVEGAMKRFEMARELHQQLQRAWLALVLLIQFGRTHYDFRTLGFETQAQWAAAIGLDQSTFSKLKLVGSVFAGDWALLPEVDRANLTVEGLYYAARMVKIGEWTKDRALNEAVSMPGHYIWEAYLAVKNNNEPLCLCPVCGGQHMKRVKADYPSLD